MKLQYKFIILYLAQGISLLCSIISAPIGLSYFGVEKYGLFALIWTLLTFLQMSSFGIPSSNYTAILYVMLILLFDWVKIKADLKSFCLFDNIYIQILIFWIIVFNMFGTNQVNFIYFQF